MDLRGCGGGGVPYGLAGQRGMGEVCGPPAHGGLSLLPQGRARVENFRGRKFSAAARQNPARLIVCRNGCAEMQRGGAHGIFPRRAPFGRKESPPWAGVPPVAVRPPLARKTLPHASAATVHSFAPRCRAIAHVPEGGKDLKTRRSGSSRCSGSGSVLVSGTLLAAASKWGRAALASTRGPCGVGGRSFRGLTRPATEMERGEEEATTGRRDASQRNHFCRCQARRLPTSDRR